MLVQWPYAIYFLWSSEHCATFVRNRFLISRLKIFNALTIRGLRLVIFWVARFWISRGGGSDYPLILLGRPSLKWTGTRGFRTFFLAFFRFFCQNMSFYHSKSLSIVIPYNFLSICGLYYERHTFLVSAVIFDDQLY